MATYNIRSEKALIKQFYELEPVAGELHGVYTSELPGAAFMQPLKKLFLRLSGLPGWQGKRFFGDYALNMIQRDGKTVDGPKMLLSQRPHQKDDKPGLVATYDANAPYLWRHCTDEFRQLDENTVLGMSHFDLPGFRGQPVMFVLHKAEAS